MSKSSSQIALKLLKLQKGDSLLDLGCGQGVLARSLPPGVGYAGVDAAPSLIHSAKAKSKHPFYVSDITQPLSIKEKPFLPRCDDPRDSKSRTR